MGTPYRYAGTTPNGFDCSGFTQFVYAHFGYHLPRTSRLQAQKYPAIKRKKLQKGDLVYFSGRKINKTVHHVGIITQVFPNQRFNFIHASSSKGVVISQSSNAYFSKRYLKANRVLTIQNEKKREKNRGKRIIYTVEKGNTLYSIAQQYNCSVKKIKEWNSLKSNTLTVGQKIIIKIN